MEPGLGETEFAVDGGGGNGQSSGGFLNGHTGEVSHLDDLRGAGVFEGKAVEGIVQFEQDITSAAADIAAIFEVNGQGFGTLFRLGVADHIDENIAHDAGRHGEEVGAALKRSSFRAGHAEVGFVDEAGGTERNGPSAAKVAGGEFLELRVEDGDKLLAGIGVPLAGFAQQHRDIHLLQDIEWTDKTGG